MSMSWGPAFDAEVGYRQQQVRTSFRRASQPRAAARTPRTNRRRAAQQVDHSAVATLGRPAHAA